MTITSALTQWFPPEDPPLTEANLPLQEGKVFIVSGGNSGVGFELIKILYRTGATVYLAARSERKARDAIIAVEDDAKTMGLLPSQRLGRLKFLHLDLDDLCTIEATAAAFAGQESRLDVLWNNAGIFNTVPGLRTKQGHEQHFGVNCVAPLLLTQLLLPQLKAAAANPPKPTSSADPTQRYHSRVVWTSSFMTDAQAPVGGIDFAEIEAGGSGRTARDYGASRAGNWLLAVECARRWGQDGVLSVAQNPGNLHGRGWADSSAFTMLFVNRMLYAPVYGAYTELFAGLSASVTEKDNGGYIVPWGKIVSREEARADIVKAMKGRDEGGSDLARRFWEYCEDKFVELK